MASARWGHAAAAARARWRRAALAALAVALLGPTLSGCLSSGYTYVSNTSTQTFFKVPDGWTVYRQAEIRKLSPASASQGGALPFLVYLDANPRPTLSEVQNFTHSAYPVGVARVRQLGASESDQYSFASLRNEVVNVDDVLNSDPNALQVHAAPKLIDRNGLRGNQLEYTISPPGDVAFTVDQVGLVDSSTQKVWFLLVACSATCYARNEGAIHRIIESWTVRGK